eukprot:TRINITY_DN7415_c0_g3_i1.p1 TRINITY_DN7415_c0_g3~~TRINITY_DN7415_c0_g3_i1.p1  ORF type:complete len:327 (+),score=65.97 TRINITY_DN7415_c0_g3_i1:106-981(+)
MSAASGTVMFLGYSGACSSAALSITLSGFATQTGFSYSRIANGTTCGVSWACQACNVQSNAALINVTAVENEASAAIISWTIAYTPLIPTETNVVTGVAVPQEPNAVFRGASPTVALVGLVPTIFEPLSARSISGYRLFNGSVFEGSTTGASVFFTAASVVSLNIKLTPNVASYSVVAESLETSWVDMLVRVFSLGTGLFTGAAILLTVWELLVKCAMRRGRAGGAAYTRSAGFAQTNIKQPLIEMNELADGTNAGDAEASLELRTGEQLKQYDQLCMEVARLSELVRSAK